MDRFNNCTKEHCSGLLYYDYTISIIKCFKTTRSIEMTVLFTDREMTDK